MNPYVLTEDQKIRAAQEIHEVYTPKGYGLACTLMWVGGIWGLIGAGNLLCAFMHQPPLSSFMLMLGLLLNVPFFILPGLGLFAWGRFKKIQLADEKERRWSEAKRIGS